MAIKSLLVTTIFIISIACIYSGILKKHHRFDGTHKLTLSSKINKGIFIGHKRRLLAQNTYLSQKEVEETNITNNISTEIDEEKDNAEDEEYLDPKETNGTLFESDEDNDDDYDDGYVLGRGRPKRLCHMFGCQMPQPEPTTPKPECPPGQAFDKRSNKCRKFG